MPPALAGPLAKPRRPELDSGVKVAVAEALYLVAANEAGRRALWQANAHCILQVGLAITRPSTIERVALELPKGCA